MAEINWGLLNTQPNFVGDYQNAFEVGRNLAKQALTQKALSTYASDPQGSINAMMAVDPDRAIQLQGFQQQQSDRQARINAATAYASGDMTGARTALAGTGDLNDQVTIDQHVAALTAAQRDQAAKVAQIIGNVASAALQYPQEQRASILQHLKPSLIAQGVPEDQLNNVDLSDAGLAAIRDSSLTFAERLQQATLAETQRHNMVEERMPKPVAVGSDQTLYNANPLTPQGGGGQGGAAGSGAAGGGAAPTGGVYDTIAQTAQSAGATPAEVAYLQRTAQIESHGDPAALNGSSTGLFQFKPQTFQEIKPGGNINSPQDQTQAALQMSRQDRQTLQAAGIAPTDANTYLMHQQGAAGGKALLMADQRDPTQSAVSVLTGIYGNAGVAREAIVRNGGDPAMTVGQFVGMWQNRFGQGQASPGPAPQGGGQTGGGVLFQGQNAKASQALNGAAQSGLTGQQLLETLPAAQQAQVKALAEGRMQFPSGAALKTPYWQNLIGVVAQYDPTFNAQDFNARARTRQDFTSGQAARNMTALATAINHGEEVLKTGDALGNIQFPLVGNAINAAKNTALSASGDPRVNNFKAAAQTYLTEVAKVLQGGPPHEGELKKAQQILNDANSPAQIHEAVKTIAGLLMGRFGPLLEQYNTGMGTVDKTPPSISPSVWASFQRQLAGGAPAAASSGGASPGGFKVLGVTP